MNVLVVSSKFPPEYAGSGLRAYNTYKRLSQKYFTKFEVLCSSVISNKTKKYQFNDVKVNLIAKKLNYHLRLPKANNTAVNIITRVVSNLLFSLDYWVEASYTFSYLKRNANRFDIVHIIGEANVTRAAITFAKMSGKPMVVELVNLRDSPHQYEPTLFSIIWGKRFPEKTLLICISDYLKKSCLKHGYSEKQIWCRPNPVDEKRFFYDRSTNSRMQFREKLKDITEEDVLLIYLAKFMPIKNQMFLVGVMERLPEKYRLIMAGPLIESGPLFMRDYNYYQSVLSSIRQKRLSDRVEVIPHFIAEPERYIKASDVYLMPSIHEAFGTPVAEALSCGVPVVANNIPGVFDQWVRDGENGFICNLDENEWANKIILASRIDCDKMRRASRRILEVASTDVIDKEHVLRMKSLLYQGLKRKNDE